MEKRGQGLLRRNGVQIGRRGNRAGDGARKDEPPDADSRVLRSEMTWSRLQISHGFSIPAA